MSNRASLDVLLADALTSDYPRDLPQHVQTKRNLLIAACAGALVTLVLGSALGQTQRSAGQNATTRSALVDRVKIADGRVAAMEGQVRVAQQDLQAAEDAKLSGTSLGADAAARLARLRFAAGFTPRGGRGVQLSVSDAPSDPSVPLGGVQLGHILDRDLQIIVNGLWKAGALAISINGRRLTSTSAIRSAGEAVLVNYRPLLQPYVVTAIGTSGDEIAGKFRNDQGGFLLEQLATQYGVVWSLEISDHVVVPAATSTVGGN